ncbi:hypothetical protein CFP56_017000 [Quercus suber]|uniref:Uncharacterized protein n=1 Tax=Quercus suber TaxID=58331 RepID=A0AAW0KN87_QUESU
MLPEMLPSHVQYKLRRWIDGKRNWNNSLAKMKTKSSPPTTHLSFRHNDGTLPTPMKKFRDHKKASVSIGTQLQNENLTTIPKCTSKDNFTVANYNKPPALVPTSYTESHFHVTFNYFYSSTILSFCPTNNRPLPSHLSGLVKEHGDVLLQISNDTSCLHHNRVTNKLKRHLSPMVPQPSQSSPVSLATRFAPSKH